MAVSLLPDFSTSPVSGSSATLKPVSSSGGRLVSNDNGSGTTSAPKTTSAPSTSTTMQVGGWYGGRQWDGSRLGNPGEVIVGNSNSNPFNNVGVSDPYAEMRALADEYANNANNALNERENYLKGEDYQAGLSDIDRSAQQVSDNLAARNREAGIQSAADEEALGKSYRTAQDDAVRSYNALQQRARVLFGRGSSAGAAGTEIAQEAYYKQQGGVSQAFINQEGQIRARAAQVAREYDDNLKDLDYWKQDATAKLKKNLQDALQEIAMKRNEIEANKTQMRLAALQQAQSYAQQIKSIALQQQANIQQAIAEKMLNINNDFTTIAKSYNIDTSNQPYIQFSTDPTKFGQITYQSPETVMRYLAKVPGQSEDDLNATNPFFA